MFKQWQEMQASFEEIKQKIGHLRAHGESGAGLVKVIVNGHKQLLSVAIDPSLMQPAEQQTLQDLIAGAVNLALQSADTQVKALLQEKTMGILGQLPTDLLV